MSHLRRAVHVIADSEFTKNELLTFTECPAEKISVVPLGGDHLPFDSISEENVIGFRQKCQVRQQSSLILHVGSCDERKNILTLLRAFAMILKSSHRDLYLVQLGGEFSPEQSEMIGRLGLEDRVRQIKRVSPFELACAYRACRLMIFPSTYEGFGLPVLEAMTAGKPVVALRAASLPELVGDSGMVVEANDPGEIARAALAVVDDQPLWQRLSQKARQRAAEFTWRRTASETLAVYRQVHERELRA
jgi:glycosyltransferase involved in cell wall biosynthesis